MFSSSYAIIWPNIWHSKSTYYTILYIVCWEQICLEKWWNRVEILISLWTRVVQVFCPFFIFKPYWLKKFVILKLTPAVWFVSLFLLCRAVGAVMTVPLCIVCVAETVLNAGMTRYAIIVMKQNKKNLVQTEPLLSSFCIKERDACFRHCPFSCGFFYLMWSMILR